MILPFLIGSAAALALFAAAWLWARKIDNYSIVDAVWAFGIGLLAGGWLATGSGNPAKRIAAAALILAWSLRLGYHLQRRIAKAHPEEDPRYDKLRSHWHGRVARSFFWFFEGQALSVILLAFPFLLIAVDRSPFGFWEISGSVVTLAAISGEAFADYQITLFKRHNSDPKAVCKEGLWRYSRHPNYFFESLIWVGFFLFALGSAHGWTAVYSPLVITYLLLKVTGVPATEASALARKGDAYRDYQRTTSVFIPLPPRLP
ncbi:MAG: 3-oxo-5-alpha-steroid 4-dehydrogenase [Akkermansiaceae bacterium]|nr:3-oxo-5-alpha-steroid 4-dehydrogenase [Akkermansiaceae bacterium]